MELTVKVLVSAIALLHLYFLVLEMFFWTKPKGLKVFGQTLEQAKSSKVLAANQGLYNGFLSAGLIWGVFHPVAGFAVQIQVFFLSCVAVAGIYGGVTVNPKVAWIQATPAILGLLLIFTNGFL